MSMPTDILFAQKASSCVKAAGMDPRQMDLKRFYELAAIIFTRAYLGIFKEKLYGIILEPQNDDDLASNAQKVINGLLLKTNDPHLYAVSGTDVVSGIPEAVDAIVGVLYSEGNRLWLKKLNKIEEDRAEAMNLETNSNREEYKSRAVAHIGGVRRNRPSSAPSRSKSGHRGRIAAAAAQAAAVERLFSAGRNRAALQHHLALQAASQPTSSSRYGYRKEDTTHTYDMKSGRKVLLSQGYLDALTRQRKNEAVINLKNMSEIREAGNRRNNEEDNLPLVPSRPEWPGHSTSASVDKWMKRMMVSRNGEDIDSALSRPCFYAAYQLMEKLDMVISIEHCFNCAHHSLSLRHDPNEYSKNTDTVLRAVAQLAHESGLCARVGVTRMRARITCKSKQTDVDSRIGAFEVQVAFRNSKGEILTELLHSKLLSRHWPSRSVMEKKLKAFILTSGIAVHPLYDPNSHSDGIGLDGLGPYPTGFVEWEETPLAETFWVFPTAGCAPLPAFASAPTPLEMLRNPELGSLPTPVVPRKKTGGFINLNCNMANVENVENKSLAVQWVFDARSVPGIIEKPPVVYQAVPPPSAPTLKRRPLSASATKSSSASNLAKVCAKQLSPRASEKTCSTASDETEEVEPKEDDDSVDHESSSCSKSTADELKAILCKNISKGRENMTSVPYIGALVISKGIVAAETIACCTLLRRAVISLCVSKHSVSHVTTASSASIDVAAIFDGLDRRKCGTLNIADIDAILTLLQNRKPSALAARLVMLSIDTKGSGNISVEEFMAFMNHHRKFNSSTFIEHALEDDEDSSPENESEGVQELGIICMQIREYLREAEESNGLERFMKEILSYVTDKTEGNGNLGCGTCEQYLFLGAFVKNGLKAKLDGGSLSLLQRAFCVDETFSSVRAVNFVKWLEAGGRDDVEESIDNADDADDMVFEDRELIFNMVTVEGSALKLKSAHDLQISVTIGGQSYVASVFPSKERGTGKRTFKVDWKPIPVNAETFRSQVAATVTMIASPQNSEEKFEVSDTVTLTRFMVAIKAAFEVSIVLPAPRLLGDTVDSAANSQKSGSDKSDAEEIRITLYGTAREASQAAMRRISLMKTEDLIRVTFDPLPADDDFSSPSSSTCTSPRHGSPDKSKTGIMKGDAKTQEDLGIIDEDEDQSADHVLPDAEPDTPQSEQSDMGESISTDGSEKGQPPRRASTKNIPSDNIQRRNKVVVSKQPVVAVTPTLKSSAPVEVEDDEIDYDIDFSPDSVSMTPDAPLSPRRRERPKSAVKEQKKVTAPTRISEKVEVAPKKVEIMVDSNDYEDDEYEVDFE